MRKPAWRIFPLFAGFLGCATLLVFDSLAQSYPVKSIRIVVGYTPGGSTDTLARMVGQKLSENLGQPVIVENRPGASSSIANERVSKSSADGHTLLLLAYSAATLPALNSKLPYDLERDFAPIVLVARGTSVLVVNPSVPARNVAELIGLARSQPGKLNFGSDGVGSSATLAGGLFNLMAKVNIVEVAYKGAAEVIVATAAGQIEMSFPSMAASRSLLESGKLRPLAVTSGERSALLPSIPTLNESGLPGYDRTSWYGLVAPAGVPKEIVARLNAVISKAVSTPEMKESFNKQGLEPQTKSPEAFAALIHSEIVESAKLIQATGVKAR